MRKRPRTEQCLIPYGPLNSRLHRAPPVPILFAQVLAMDATWRALRGGTTPDRLPPAVAAAVAEAVRGSGYGSDGGSGGATPSDFAAPNTRPQQQQQQEQEQGQQPEDGTKEEEAPSCLGWWLRPPAEGCSPTGEGSPAAPAAPVAPRDGLRTRQLVGAARRALLSHPVLWPALQRAAALPAAPSAMGPGGRAARWRVVWDDDNTPIYVSGAGGVGRGLAVGQGIMSRQAALPSPTCSVSLNAAALR